jgi:hypothetical protein
MSGTALAQKKRHSEMLGNRQENYKTHGEHEKVLVHYSGDHVKCMDCDTKVENDGFGWDILKGTACGYNG